MWLLTWFYNLDHHGLQVTDYGFHRHWALVNNLHYPKLSGSAIEISSYLLNYTVCSLTVIIGVIDIAQYNICSWSCVYLHILFVPQNINLLFPDDILYSRQLCIQWIVQLLSLALLLCLLSWVPCMQHWTNLFSILIIENCC